MILEQLAAHLESYLRLRRALGFAMHAEERLLRDFIGFASRAEATALRSHVAVDWAQSTADTCGPGGQARRLSVVRGFLLYVSAFDPQTAVPAVGLLRGAARPKPHIYTDAQIQALLSAARCLRPWGSLRPYTFETLIGLLLSTGLRTSEAIRLRDEDVELESTPPCLSVHQTKFRKSRIVPIHPSTAAALQTYRDHRGRLGGDDQAETFFLSHRGAPLKYRAVYRTFVNLVRKIGLPDPAGQRGPTLHGLRHTFAVQRLLAWYREGRDVQAQLPELVVYLGHVRPESTYWYLTATPELLRTAATRFESYAHEQEAP